MLAPAENDLHFAHVGGSDVQRVSFEDHNLAT